MFFDAVFNPPSSQFHRPFLGFRKPSKHHSVTNSIRAGETYGSLKAVSRKPLKAIFWFFCRKTEYGTLFNLHFLSGVTY